MSAETFGRLCSHISFCKVVFVLIPSGITVVRKCFAEQPIGVIHQLTDWCGATGNTDQTILIIIGIAQALAVSVSYTGLIAPGFIVGIAFQCYGTAAVGTAADGRKEVKFTSFLKILEIRFAY